MAKANYFLSNVNLPFVLKYESTYILFFKLFHSDLQYINIIRYQNTPLILSADDNRDKSIYMNKCNPRFQVGTSFISENDCPVVRSRLNQREVMCPPDIAVL